MVLAPLIVLKNRRNLRYTWVWMVMAGTQPVTPRIHMFGATLAQTGLPPASLDTIYDFHRCTQLMGTAVDPHP